jgi:hypothetical protein
MTVINLREILKLMSFTDKGFINLNHQIMYMMDNLFKDSQKVFNLLISI